MSEPDGAGSADALITATLCSSQEEIFPQNLQQRGVRRSAHLHRFVINIQIISQ
jgi:hypothetical protein